MGTVVLDFDSTLIAEESLELALEAAIGGAGAARAEIERVTRAGMEGEIGFAESLARRLAIAQPTRQGLQELGRRLASELTRGAAELVAGSHAAGHAVWIVSGAFRDVLLPSGEALGIPKDRIWGVRARWDADGQFVGLDPADGFARSKVEGVRQLAPDWPRPAVGVGDGMTDHALWVAGLVDGFVPYVEHARRRAVMALGLTSAASMEELAQCLATQLK